MHEVSDFYVSMLNEVIAVYLFTWHGTVMHDAEFINP